MAQNILAEDLAKFFDFYENLLAKVEDWIAPIYNSCYSIIELLIKRMDITQFQGWLANEIRLNIDFFQIVDENKVFLKFLKFF